METGRIVWHTVCIVLFVWCCEGSELNVIRIWKQRMGGVPFSFLSTTQKIGNGEEEVDGHDGRHWFASAGNHKRAVGQHLWSNLFILTFFVTDNLNANRNKTKKNSYKKENIKVFYSSHFLTNGKNDSIFFSLFQSSNSNTFWRWLSHGSREGSIRGIRSDIFKFARALPVFKWNKTPTNTDMGVHQSHEVLKLVRIKN